MASSLYGYGLDSDLIFERAREGPAPRGGLEVRRAPRPILRAQGHPAVSVEDRFTVHREPRGLSIWCAFSGVFDLDARERRISTYASIPDGAALEHRLACAIVPLLLAERGDVALHASAVEAAGAAVAFAGASGRGKSTLAWALGSRGHRILAEDGCVIAAGPGGLRLWPGLTDVRLRGDDGSAVVAEVPNGGAGPLPLGAVVLLEERRAETPVLLRVPATEALTAVMPNTMHAQGDSLVAAFRGAAEIARTVPVFRGSLPDDLAGAPEHAEHLLDMVLDEIG